MNKILAALILSTAFFSCQAFAIQGQMIAKDYWLKKHVPGVATELCEGRIMLCIGVKREACNDLFLPSAKSCGEKMYASMPDYLSGKEQNKKYKLDVRECTWAANREQVGRMIRANPKAARRRECLEFLVPNAPAPNLDDDVIEPKKPKAAL